MYFIGGKLKARGSLGGRFADALTWQVLAFCALRRYKAEGNRPEDLPLVAYACEYALARIQEAFEGIHANFDAPLVGWWLRVPSSWFLRLNPLSRGPSDKLVPKAAATIQLMNEQYKRITDGIAPYDEADPGMGRLMKAFRLYTESRPAAEKITRAQRARELPKGMAYDLADLALERKVITAQEAELLKEANAAAMAAIEVDVFKPEDYFLDVRS
ncbi:MAG TPA: acyl-CoA dehydrogenase domain-containing protein, partial [Pseudohongiella sp.]|nr:acyl-CoA dehydrogenase domain-containing protein [Pseudohongiella sp.]